MAAISNFLENELIDHVLRGAPYTSPGQVYVALHTANPTDAATGAEVGGGGYERQAVTFIAPTDGQTANQGNIVYENMPSSVVTHVAIWDSASGGNMLFHGALTSAKNVDAGDTFIIAVGDLDVTLQ